MKTTDEKPHSSHCPVCDRDSTVLVTESFREGRFVRCELCGGEFAECTSINLKEYYDRVWCADNPAVEDYREKMQALNSPASLQSLVVGTPRCRWAVSRLGELARGASVLDVGCGEGAVLWWAKNMGLEPFGCDLSTPAVELARGLIGETRVRVGTVEDMRFQAKSFDCIIALEILEHLPHPRPFLSEVARILKPSGLFLLTTPNKNRFFSFMRRLLGKPHASTDYPPHHYMRWTRSSLERLLDGFFDDVKISSLRYSFKHVLGKHAALPIHVLTLGRMGQSLCVTARSPKA